MSDDGGLGLLLLGPAGAVGLYWMLYRYYRNTDKSHAFERETLVEAQPVTGAERDRRSAGSRYPRARSAATTWRTSASACSGCATTPAERPRSRARQPNDESRRIGRAEVRQLVGMRLEEGRAFQDPCEIGLGRQAVAAFTYLAHAWDIGHHQVGDGEATRRQPLAAGEHRLNWPGACPAGTERSCRPGRTW